jgi:hypothetical protein
MRKQAVWDPLANVGKAVDSLLEPPVSTASYSAKEKSKGGRPRVDGRGRLVLYLNEQQIYNLKRDALEKRIDVSTLAREVFKRAGY